MNVIAGLLIGFFNDSWIARLLIPLAWGLVYYGYRVIRLSPSPAMVAKDTGEVRRLMPKRHFFLLEYLTAVLTALPSSLLAGVVKSIFT